MIQSVISSHHYYYVFFFESSKIKSLKAIPELFGGQAEAEFISPLKNKEHEFLHLQLEIDRLYGSETVLLQNKSKKSKKNVLYWYDLYVGKIEVKNVSYYFVCYPYNKMGKYLVGLLESNGIQCRFYKPKVEQVLIYMKDRKEKEISKREKEGFLSEITKYSGQVKDDDDKANRVNIIGQNPLKSRTYELLSTTPEIYIETISLKLQCKQLKVGDLELSFDRLGNYRFWLKRFAENTSIPVIPYSFKFLMEVAPMQESDFISSNTLLENE